MRRLDDEGCEHSSDMSCRACWLGDVKVGDKLFYEHFQKGLIPCVVTRLQEGNCVVGVVFENQQPANLYAHDFVRPPWSRIAEAVRRRHGQ